MDKTITTTSNGRATPICPICADIVPWHEWTPSEGTHRRKCLERNKDTLSSRLTANASCIRCNSGLLNWPSFIQEQFKCPACPKDTGNKKNNDRNLFKCFVCETDLCLYCVQSRRYLAWKKDSTPGDVFDGNIHYEVEYDEKKIEVATGGATHERSEEASAPPPSYDEVLALREEEAMFKCKC